MNIFNAMHHIAQTMEFGQPIIQNRMMNPQIPGQTSPGAQYRSLRVNLHGSFNRCGEKAAPALPLRISSASAVSVTVLGFA